jgi:spore coat polysaccharide biosynthesis predicted glycosyltransferase SpsG
MNPNDFVNDSQLLMELSKFAKISSQFNRSALFLPQKLMVSMVVKTKNQSHFNLTIISSKEIQNSKKVLNRNANDDAKDATYKNIAEDQLWLSVDVVDLAEQLTLYESKIFCEMNCSSLALQNMEQSSLRFVTCEITLNHFDL